jgi:hypothetical protein
MAEMVYAVHTRTCTYLLDEEGVCGWVLSPSGGQAQDRCIGAQFVACLDLQEQGGLVGELRVGAAGLFARREGGRFVLLKTSTIEQVEYRRAGEYRRQAEVTMTAALVEVPRSDAAAQAVEAGPDTLRMQQRTDAHQGYPAQARGWPALDQYVDRYEPSTGPMPPGYDAGSGADEYAPVASADLEEVSTFSSEVTLSLPLYRPEPEDPPPRWDSASLGGAEAVSGAAPQAPYAWPADEDAWRRR